MNYFNRKYKVGDIIRNIDTGKEYLVSYISKVYDFNTYILRNIPDNGHVIVCGVDGLDTDKSYLKVITHE